MLLQVLAMTPAQIEQLPALERQTFTQLVRIRDSFQQELLKPKLASSHRFTNVASKMVGSLEVFIQPCFRVG
jgi:hypothetical protein